VGGVGGGREGCEGATRGAYQRSPTSETSGLLFARCGREIGATMGRDGAPVTRMIVAFAITVAVRAELDLKQFALY
jgi:hypothetical protein